MKDFLLIIALAAISISVIYFIGSIIVRLMKLPIAVGLFGLFLRLVFGLSIAVTSYALIQTGLNSIMAGVIVMLAGVIWHLRNSPQIVSTEMSLTSNVTSTDIHILTSGKQVGLLVGITVLITALRFPMLYDVATAHYNAPFLDFVYYSKLTYLLNKKGVETTLLFPDGLVALKPQPYHYFELWLNALIVRLTPLAPASSLFVLTYSLLITVVYFGYCALFEFFGQPRFRALMLGGMCLFISGVFLTVFNRSALLVNGSYGLQPYLIVRPKLAPVYIFMLLGCLLYVRKNKPAAFWSWATLPLLFVSTAPAVLASLSLLAIGLALRTKQKFDNWIRLTLPVLIVVTFVICFYFINAKLYLLLGAGNTSEVGGVHMQDIISQPREWHTSIHIMVGTLLAFTAYYILYGVILLALAMPHVWRAWAAIGPHGELLILLASLLITGAVAAGIAFHLIDAGQFFDNIATVGSAVMFALVAALLLYGRGPQPVYKLLAGMGILLAINLQSAGWRLPMHQTTNYNPNFLQQVAQSAPNFGTTGAYILGDEDYNGPDGRFIYNSDLCTPGLYLGTELSRETIWFSLSHLTLNPNQASQTAPNNSAQVRNWVINSSIQLFARKLRTQHPELTDEDIQRSFVLQQHINFISASPSAVLPASIRPLVSRILYDSVTRERLYLLNVK